MHRRSRTHLTARVSARLAFLGFCVAMIGVPVLYGVLRLAGYLAVLEGEVGANGSGNGSAVVSAGIFDTFGTVYWGGFVLFGVGGVLMSVGGLLLFSTLHRPGRARR